MKIGINASFLRKPATGIGQVSVHFLRALIEQETERGSGDVFILFVEEDIAGGLLPEMPENFSVTQMLPPYKRDDLIRKIWWEKFLLPRTAKGEGCEAFLSLYQSPTIMPSGVRHIMIVHDLIPRLFPQYLNNFRKKLYQNLSESAMRNATHLIAVSERTMHDVMEFAHIPRERMSWSHISVDEIFDALPERQHIMDTLDRLGVEKPYIYTGGGLELRKNVENTLLAYKNILDLRLNPVDLSQQDKEPLPHLVISGKLMPELAPLWTDVGTRVRELGISEHVTILGFVSQADLPALYAGAEAFLFPSHYEGFGMPVLESMKMGTAVLTAKNSSLPEVGGEAVLYCDDNNLDDITAKMTVLLDGAELRKTLAADGLQRASRFTWSSFLGHTRDIIHKTT